MKRVFLSAILLAAGSAMASGSKELELLGHFDNVVSSSGEHCEGYSLDLWSANGRLLGLLHHHEGLCGDPQCAVLDAATIERKSGRLAFSSTILGERFTFQGLLKPTRVVGKLNGMAVQFKMQPRDPVIFKPDTDVGAWCSFWKSVPRCRGVEELCTELR